MKLRKQLNFFDSLNISSKKETNMSAIWMAGNSQYSAIEGFKEATTDFENDSLIFLCDEIKFIESNSNIIALMKMKDLAGLWKAEEHSKDDLFYLVFHSEKYQKYSAKEKKKVECEPTPFEKYILEFFKNGAGKQWIEQKLVFKGSLATHFQDNVLALLPTTPSLVFTLETVDEPQFLNKDVSVKASGGWSRGSAKLQTEAEKLNDRKAFVFKELNVSDCANIHEASLVLQETKALNDEAKYLLELMINQ
jgi:hypothetical protein